MVTQKKNKSENVSVEVEEFGLFLISKKNIGHLWKSSGNSLPSKLIVLLRATKRMILLSCCSAALQRAQKLPRLCSGTDFWRADFVVLKASLFATVIPHLKLGEVFITTYMYWISHSRAGHALEIYTLIWFYFLNSDREILDFLSEPPCCMWCMH